MDTKERFEQYVNKTNNCWLWTGACHKRGYGDFHIAGKTGKAHRVAYELYVGPIPEGLHVLHGCDVRNCVNPAHLFLGTQDDNMKDKAKKGRATPEYDRAAAGKKSWVTRRENLRLMKEVH